MKITFLIGNGFDLNLGMKTSYQDFYEYYSQLSSENDLIAYFKNELGRDSDYEFWKDFELGLGVFSAKVDSEDAFIEIISDALINLKSYLKIEDERLSINEINLANFRKDFCHPYIELPEKEKNIIRNTLYILPEYVSINFLNLNYTSSIERILNAIQEGKKDVIFDNKFKFSDEVHIHRSLINDGIILGVNDESQIANEAFRKSEVIKNFFIKPCENESFGHLNDDEAKRILKSTNLLCIYGASLGETDDLWRKLIGKWLISNSDNMLIYFYHNDKQDFLDSVIRLEQRKVLEIQRIKQTLLKNLGLDDLKFGSKIFVVINSQLFKRNNH